MTTFSDRRSEPAAKAALLSFLRSEGSLSRRSVVTTELVLDKQTARADVALCDRSHLHCYEVKSHRDTLGRLDRQIATYALHSDFVTVVAASKHVNAVLSRTPSYVGVYELVTFAPEQPLRVVRSASRSPLFDVDAMLSLLPVTELGSRLLEGRRLKRDAAIELASCQPDVRKKQAVLAFLRERYGANSQALLNATRRRTIVPDDLVILRRRSTSSNKDSPISAERADYGWSDEDVFNHVGRSFGPVPDAVRALLTA